MPRKRGRAIRFNGLWITLWLFNIAMGNGPFIDDFPIKTSIYKGFSMAMLNNQMVNLDFLLMDLRLHFTLMHNIIISDQITLKTPQIYDH